MRVIAGDFNIDVLRANTPEFLKDVLDTFGLVQLIKNPTRMVSGTAIDLILLSSIVSCRRHNSCLVARKLVMRAVFSRHLL